MRSVVPISNLSTRLPTLGRLRMGVKVAGTSKNGKAYERPKSIDTWRLTSHDEQALEQVASIYGGIVKPWTEPRTDPGQFELVTETNELRIVLPPDPLGGSPIYEHWTGGGCDRRCDGLSCAQIVRGPDGAEQIEVPCLCVAEQAMACDPHTRLSVILPDVRFGGVWMLDTKGWDAAQELPGMVELLQTMQGRGLTAGLLRLEHRRKVSAGETRMFPVPVLALEQTMDALVAGQARFIGSGSSDPMPELGTGESPTREDGDVVKSGSPLAEHVVRSPDSDDEVVDAEVVDDRTLADVLPAGVTDARALVVARRLLGGHVTECSQVTDYKQIARVLDELVGA